MKHHPSVLKKVRKLLRLAKAPGPEGLRAAERARELMERHSIDEVSLDQRVLVEVPGVDGELWREQVLIAVAQAAGVELLQKTVDGKHSAALRGEKADVTAAVTAFRRVTLEISRRCSTQAQQSLVGCPKDHPAQRVWAMVFHMGAASSLGETVAEALARARKERKGKPLGQPTDPDGVDMTPPEKPKTELQQEKSDKALEAFEQIFMELIQRIGLEKAELVREIAFRTGVDHGKQVSLVERAALPRYGHVPEWTIDKSRRLEFRVEERHGDPAIGFLLKDKVV